MDPELPFYYHISKHSRYYEGFSIQPVKTKVKQLPWYELLDGFLDEFNLPHYLVESNKIRGPHDKKKLSLVSD